MTQGVPYRKLTAVGSERTTHRLDTLYRRTDACTGRSSALGQPLHYHARGLGVGHAGLRNARRSTASSANARDRLTQDTTSIDTRVFRGSEDESGRAPNHPDEHGARQRGVDLREYAQCVHGIHVSHDGDAAAALVRRRASVQLTRAMFGQLALQLTPHRFGVAKLRALRLDDRRR